MGKIVAIGGGGVQDGELFPILERIASLAASKTPRVVFLPTAAFDDDDDEDALSEQFGRLGASSFEVLRLSDESLTREHIAGVILGADIIYAGGGNLKFLMDTWKKSGAVKYFREAFARGTVLSGTSSGAMCWFAEGYDDCGEDGAFMFVECLGLLPWCNCPHFENDGWQGFAQAVRARAVPGVAAENQAALVCDDGHFSVTTVLEGQSVLYFDRKYDFERIDLAERALETL